MTRELEPDDVFDARCERLRAAINDARAAVAFGLLSDRLGEGDPLTWADRIYQPLEDMPKRDLALMVVLLLEREANQLADRTWSFVHTVKPKDMR